MDERPGYKLVVLGGRGYPTEADAIAALRRALAKDGIEVPDADIFAYRWIDKPVYCPFAAKAWIPVRKR